MADLWETGRGVFSFLQRDLPAFGRVLYPGAMPPPLGSLPGLGGPVTCSPAGTSPGQLWAVEARHPAWGVADVVCERDPAPLPDPLIDVTLSLSEAEKARARLGQSTVAVRVRVSVRAR